MGDVVRFPVRAAGRIPAVRVGGEMLLGSAYLAGGAAEWMLLVATTAPPELDLAGTAWKPLVSGSRAVAMPEDLGIAQVARYRARGHRVAPIDEARATLLAVAGKTWAWAEGA